MPLKPKIPIASVLGLLKDLTVHQLEEVTVEVDKELRQRSSGGPIEPVRVRVSLPSFCRWAKILSGIDHSKDTGFAFLGKWAPRDRDFEQEEGAIILVYWDSGPAAHLYRVTDGVDGGLELVAKARGKSWALDLRDIADEALREQRKK